MYLSWYILTVVLAGLDNGFYKVTKEKESHQGQLLGILHEG